MARQSPEGKSPYIFVACPPHVTIKDRLSSRFRIKNAMHSLLPVCLLFLRLHTLLSDLPDPSTPRPQVNEDGSANWVVAGFIMIYTVTVVFTVLEVDFSWAFAPRLVHMHGTEGGGMLIDNLRCAYRALPTAAPRAFMCRRSILPSNVGYCLVKDGKRHWICCRVNEGPNRCTGLEMMNADRMTPI